MKTVSGKCKVCGKEFTVDTESLFEMMGMEEPENMIYEKCPACVEKEQADRISKNPQWNAA